MPKRTPNRGQCSIDECDKDAWARGWCASHYARWRSYGDPELVPEKKPRPTCSIDGCGRPHNARGLCEMHDRRRRKTGTTDGPKRKTTAERFWAKVDKDGPEYADLGKCWVWNAVLNESGYGVFHLNGRVARAHRWSFTQANGPIPDGNEIDHRCGNRACVNPDHLRDASRKQNMENYTVRNSNNKTGYRGVYFNGSRYIAQVTHNCRTKYVGSFSTAAEAGEAARLARLELYSYNDRDKAA